MYEPLLSTRSTLNENPGIVKKWKDTLSMVSIFNRLLFSNAANIDNRSAVNETLSNAETEHNALFEIVVRPMNPISCSIGDIIGAFESCAFKSKGLPETLNITHLYSPLHIFCVCRNKRILCLLEPIKAVHETSAVQVESS